MFREQVTLEAAKVTVSPELVVTEVDSAPHHQRLGVPALSHSSACVIVTAGMLVTVTAPFAPELVTEVTPVEYEGEPQNVVIVPVEGPPAE